MIKYGLRIYMVFHSDGAYVCHGAEYGRRWLTIAVAALAYTGVHIVRSGSYKYIAPQRAGMMIMQCSGNTTKSSRSSKCS